MFKKGGSKALLILTLLLCALALVAFQGCGGGGSFQAPSTTSSGTIITADTLKSWVDQGFTNGTSGYNGKVVILDVNPSPGMYNTTGHIPGSYYFNANDMYETRFEGVINGVNMVPDGPTMDSLVDRYGIDQNTTIVFTSSTGSYPSPGIYLSVCRLYFTFRYWGFPKERLKILNGLDAAYGFKYGLTNASTPPPVPSAFSVRSNTFAPQVRASLMEMINVADGKEPNTVPIDGRGKDGDPGVVNSSYSGDPLQTPGVFITTPTPKSYVAFEGHISGAKAVVWTSLFNGVDANGDGKIDYQQFLPPDEMAAKFTALGMDSTKQARVY